MLACMRALVPNLHEDLVDLWDAAIPKLLTSLTGTSSSTLRVFISHCHSPCPLSLTLFLSLSHPPFLFPPFPFLHPFLLPILPSHPSLPSFPPILSLPSFPPIRRPEQKEDVEPELVGGPHAKGKAYGFGRRCHMRLNHLPSFSPFFLNSFYLPSSFLLLLYPFPPSSYSPSLWTRWTTKSG